VTDIDESRRPPTRHSNVTVVGVSPLVSRPFPKRQRVDDAHSVLGSSDLLESVQIKRFCLTEMRFYCREFSKKNVISLHPHLDPGSLV